MSKYCVVRVNLTQKSYEIACAGLYKPEAMDIANRRNHSLWEYEMFRKPKYELLHHHHRHDKITYIPCRNSHTMIEWTIKEFYPEYFPSL